MLETDEGLYILHHKEGIYSFKDSSIIISRRNQTQLFGSLFNLREKTFFTSNGEIFKLNDKKEKLVYPYQGNNPLWFNLKLNDSTILLLGRNKILKFNYEEKVVPLKNDEILTKNIINGAKIINNHILVNTDIGSYEIKIDNDSINYLNTFFKNYKTNKTVIDKSGNIFISSLNKGIIYIPKISSKRILSDSKLKHLYIIDSSLYCGTYSNYFYKIDLKNYSSKKEVFNNFPSHEAVKDIYVDKKNTIVSLKGSAIIKQNDLNDEFKRIRIGSAFIITHDSLIFIANPHGIWEFSKKVFFQTFKNITPEIRKIKPAIKDIAVVAIEKIGDQLLIASKSNLYLYKINTKELKEIKSFKDGIITNIKQLNGNAYISTLNKGLWLFNKNKLEQVYKSHELLSNIEDFSVSDYDILFYHDKKHLSFIKIGSKSRESKSIPLPFNKINDLLCVNKNLYITTEKGLFKYTIDSLIKIQTPPKLYLDAFFLNDRYSQYDSNYSYSYDENRLKFNFRSISYDNSGLNIDYFYQININGDLKPWQKSSSGEINFISLNPGDYKLNIKSCRGNICSEVYHYSFIIQPPFWKTWWFRLLIALAIGASIYLFFKIRVLTYNKDVVRELIKALIQKLKKEEYIILKDTKDGSMRKIILSEVLYIKASDNYVEVHLDGNKKIVSRITMSKVYKEHLKNKKAIFHRCHRSYIVNDKKITAKHSDFIKIDEIKIPLSKSFTFKSKSENKF